MGVYGMFHWPFCYVVVSGRGHCGGLVKGNLPDTEQKEREVLMLKLSVDGWFSRVL